MIGKDVRITRFVRDPRDLVVSGYFYHRKGGEEWCNIATPTVEDWRVVNGAIPKGMFEKRESFSTFLQNMSMEERLIAEIDFRETHFNSMKEWPTADERIRLFRYEDLIGNEKDVFKEMMSHYGVSWPEKRSARCWQSVIQPRNRAKNWNIFVIRGPANGKNTLRQS